MSRQPTKNVKKLGRPRESAPPDNAKGPLQERFRDQLRQWRERAPTGRITQEKLDEAMGRPGHTGQMETGYAPPPSPALCKVIGEALGIDGDTIWRQYAAPALLERGDRSGDLVQWHEQEKARERGAPLTPSEVTLIKAVREASTRNLETPDLPRDLADALTGAADRIPRPNHPDPLNVLVVLLGALRSIPDAQWTTTLERMFNLAMGVGRGESIAAVLRRLATVATFYELPADQQSELLRNRAPVADEDLPPGVRRVQ